MATKNRLACVFSSHNDGPHGGVIQAADGNFCGLTGGNTGTFYRLSLDGTYTVLASFIEHTLGATMVTPLIPAPDDSFYGLAADGPGPGTPPVNYDSTIYHLALDGTLTTLCRFSLGGQAQPTDLLLASDGNFYGTTPRGGSAGYGFVYRVTPDGVLTILHTFHDARDGTYPEADLIQGRDGNFYGTTNAGKTGPGASTAYRITLAGEFTTLSTFTRPHQDEGDPISGLIQGADGNFYGTMSGANQADAYSYKRNNGTFFRLTPDGEFTALHVFSGTTDGTGTGGALLQLADGSFLVPPQEVAGSSPPIAPSSDWTPTPPYSADGHGDPGVQSGIRAGSH